MTRLAAWLLVRAASVLAMVLVPDLTEQEWADFEEGL